MIEHDVRLAARATASTASAATWRASSPRRSGRRRGRALEAIRPDLFLLAEWSAPDLMTRAFDADYAWPFHAALTRVLSLGRPGEPRSARRGTRSSAASRAGSLHLRFSDNHDEKRAIARFGEPAALAGAGPRLDAGRRARSSTTAWRSATPASRAGPALTERLPIFWPIVERRPEFPRLLPRDDRAAPGTRRAAPGRRRRGSTTRERRPRRVVPPPRRRRGAARGREPVEPTARPAARAAGAERPAPS